MMLDDVFVVFERGIFGMFVIIIILLLIIAKPLQKFIDYLDAHLTYHEPYRKKDGEEYGEKFHERAWLLFWTYFVFSWLLAGSLYLTQIGFTTSITNIQIGFSGYTYLIAAILIVFLARAIATTSFVSKEYREKMAPKFFTTVFGLAALGSFLSLIGLFILWVYNPQKIYNLLQVPIPLPQGVTLLDVLLNLSLILGLPAFFASIGEITINLFCKTLGHKRIEKPKKRHKPLGTTRK